MASRKWKTIGFRTEEELADAVNEIVNDSDSETDNIPEFSSSEESESESANESDNESNISILGPSRRQTDVTPTTGFSKNDYQPRIPPFIGNPGVQFSVENEADVMSYFDHYIPPELTEIVVDQTNLYAQQQIAKMPRPITKHAHSNRNQNEKIPWFDFCNWYSPKTKIRIVLVNERNFSDPSISTNNV